jgi:predicted DsbA family dithiol-disulfide isomerase
MSGIVHRIGALHTNVKIEIWSDVVCPWCYIGKTNLETALRALPDTEAVEVIYRSFLLDPAAPAQPRNAVEHLGERYGGGPEQAREMMRQVTEVAERAGLEFHLEDSLTGQTASAHRLLHLAGEHGRQRQLADRLFAAHFTENLSLFDTDSLVLLAVEAGLDETRVREVLQSDRYAQEVERDIAQARAYGVTGVPFFVFDDTYAVAGAQPPEVFSQVFERLES